MLLRITGCCFHLLEKDFKNLYPLRIHTAEISHETWHSFPLGVNNISRLYEGEAALTCTCAACSSMPIAADAPE